MQFLAEVFRRGALNAIAALAQIDTVQVLLHNHVLVVIPLTDLGPENLHDLPLNGDTLVAGGVLHQLLGDGGTAELVAASEEHIETGLHRGDPVHALMLVETLVLNGHHRVDHGLGDFIQIGPLAVRGSINLLKLLNISGGVHIINKGSLLQNVVIQGPVGCLCQNIVLQIVAQGAHKHRTTDYNDQQHRGRRHHRHLHSGKGQGAGSVDKLNQPVGIPFLAELFSPFGLLFFFHTGYLHRINRTKSAQISHFCESSDEIGKR